MLKIAVALVLLVLTYPFGGSAMLISDKNGAEKIYLVNYKGKNADNACLVSKSIELVKAVDTEKTEMFKVKIDADHQTVKDVLKNTFIKAEVPSKSYSLLIPTDKKGKMFIIIRRTGNKDSYAMMGLVDESPDVDFGSCFK